jgi:hypothetical protein
MGSRKDAKTQRVKGMLRDGDVVGVFFAPWRLERSGREIRSGRGMDHANGTGAGVEPGLTQRREDAKGERDVRGRGCCWGFLCALAS